MVDLHAANAHQDSQYLSVGCLKSQGGIEARTTLLDKCKVKPCRVCNCLHASLLGSGWRDWLRLVWRRVAIVERYRRLVVDSERPLEIRSQVRILRAAMPCVPVEIDIELQQVCQPANSFGTSRLTAGQGTEYVQVHGRLALRDQISIQERRMAQFIVGIVGDILRHIAIQVAERGYISGIAPLNSAQFVVLLP